MAVVVSRAASGASASAATSFLQVGRHAAWPIDHNDEEEAQLEIITTTDFDPIAAFGGYATAPGALLSHWMTALRSDTDSLRSIPCSTDALRECHKGWPDITCSLDIHLDGSFC